MAVVTKRIRLLEDALNAADDEHITDKAEALEVLRDYADDWKDTRVWLYDAIMIACDALEKEIK